MPEDPGCRPLHLPRRDGSSGNHYHPGLLNSSMFKPFRKVFFLMRVSHVWSSLEPWVWFFVGASDLIVLSNHPCWTWQVSLNFGSVVPHVNPSIWYILSCFLFTQSPNTKCVPFIWRTRRWLLQPTLPTTATQALAASRMSRQWKCRDCPVTSAVPSATALATAPVTCQRVTPPLLSVPSAPLPATSIALWFASLIPTVVAEWQYSTCFFAESERCRVFLWCGLEI